jgi:hypothetical protein
MTWLAAQNARQYGYFDFPGKTLLNALLLRPVIETP